MPRIFPLVTVPRNQAAVIQTFGVIEEWVEGGEYGKRKWLWPWQGVAARVYTGLFTMQVLRGERKLHLAGGSWIDFEEAVLVTKGVDPLKMVYDIRYEDVDRTMYRGTMAAEALMRANANDAIQSYMAGQRLQDVIYLSGPKVTEDLTLVVPNASVHPAFAGITQETGIEMRHLRFSGVKLSDNYVQTMEDIMLNLERLQVVRQERTDILQFLRDMVDTDPKKEPTTLTGATELFQAINFGEMLQNMSGQLVGAGAGQMVWMWPLIMGMMGGVAPGQQQARAPRGRR